MVSYWPDSETSAAQIQSLYEAEQQAGPGPFVKSGLGGLAPEIRQQIYNNLLAIPPPYAGRDYRARETQILDKSPISLATFVDLRASCLVILQVCRQIYVEAFPTFYAAKSYYLANPRDLARFFKYGGYRGYLKRGPQLCRVDTITSLCLMNLVIHRPRWTPDQIDQLMSRPHHTFDREALETEWINELDPKLILVDLDEMKSLRKICLCMRVGQEWEYLRFLFNISGLTRGVIEFGDNFHWAICSQSLSGGDWNLQYSAFPNGSYRKGKNFEKLDYRDVNIQGEVLNIDSRASDLVGDDDRWVEVDIGSRNYEEMWPDWQHAPGVVPGHGSENEERLPGGEDTDFSTDDGSDHESEDLQEVLDGEEDGTQAEREPDQESDDPQGQPEEGENGTQTDNLDEQGQEFRDLQGQPDREYKGAQSDEEPVEEPDEESGYRENLADGDDHNAQAGSDANRMLGTAQGPPDYQRLLITKDRNASIASQSNQEPESSVELVNDKTTYVQAETDPPRMPAIVPEEGNKDDLEAEPREKTLLTTDLSSRLGYENHRYAPTQTISVDSENCYAEPQTEPGELEKDLQEEMQTATAPTQEGVLPDQGAVHQPEVRDGQRVSAHPQLKPVNEPQGSTISQLEKKMATKLPQKVLNSPIPEKSKTSLATVDDSTAKTKRQFLLNSHTKLYLYRCVRVAALMFALSFLYVVLYTEWENTLGQLLALMLFILLSFVAMSLEYWACGSQELSDGSSGLL